MEERYCVVFNGEYAPGMDPLEVVARMESVFNLSRLRVLAMLGRPPAVIRQGLDMMAATQEMQVLAGLGLMTAIEPEAAVIEPPWDGVERRQGERRSTQDRRHNDSRNYGDHRRKSRGRRSTDLVAA